ncbi:MAG: hypothetical protein HY556_01775 [Euryarchaeota archaeon]|nr:hypothetical protein [Euryarchaeota archaeon]
MADVTTVEPDGAMSTDDGAIIVGGRSSSRSRPSSIVIDDVEAHGVSTFPEALGRENDNARVWAQ